MVQNIYNQSCTHLLAVDCIIFGYLQDELKLLLFKRRIEPAKGQWSLVGGWVQDNESVEDAAYRVLYGITGLKDLFLEQVQVFSEPDRDPGGRVLSVAFYALIRIDKQDEELIKKNSSSWFAISKLPKLIFDHDKMLEKALEKLRKKASIELIGRQLLPEEFTILQLRKLYSAIFQREFDPGNFRKKIMSTGILKRLDTKDKSMSKKGAYYYTYKDRSEDLFTDHIVRYL